MSSDATRFDPATPPRVSVHMPVHNTERYLDKGAASIRKQTSEDWEFIVIDGGSTEGSLAMRERHAAAEVHRKWTWWVLKERDLETAREHAWCAVRSAPTASANWRSLDCALRGDRS